MFFMNFERDFEFIHHLCRRDYFSIYGDLFHIWINNTPVIGSQE